jgi:hypothetical protein
MDQQQKTEIPTRLVEVAINRVFQILQNELKLSPIEAVFVLMKAREHLEKTAGVQVTQVDFIPDKPSTKMEEN